MIPESLRPISEHEAIRRLDTLELRTVRHSVRDMIADDRKAAKWLTAQAERFEAEGRADLAARYRRRAADRLSSANVLSARYLSAECKDCGGEFSPHDLKAGMCRWCANEADGYCACGSEPEPGFAMCGPCAAEEAADEKFHSLHEVGLL